MYPRQDASERAQIEIVFALTGGELEDAPRRYYTRAPANDGDATPRRGWFRYWYPWVPDYAEGEFRRWGGSTSGDFFTAVYDTGSYGYWQPPKRVLITGGKVARLVKIYRSSGEAECLCDAQDREDCEVCEGDGIVYLGEGWIEAVYRVR